MILQYPLKKDQLSVLQEAGLFSVLFSFTLYTYVLYILPLEASFT